MSDINSQLLQFAQFTINKQIEIALSVSQIKKSKVYVFDDSFYFAQSTFELVGQYRVETSRGQYFVRSTGAQSAFTKATYLTLAPDSCVENNIGVYINHAQEQEA